ncbi:MAG: 30S ribosomal protein S16 [Cyclobacteriaceae bacterium]
MAVKIRLARRGRKKRAMYDVVIADARAPRDGRFIEKIGTYNPNTNPASVNINEDKAFDWVMKGAQPTDTVKAMLSYKGVMFRKHLQVGVNKGAVTQEDADAKLKEWLEQKDAKVQGKIDSLSQQKAADRKARHEAESKVKEARAEAYRAKQAAELAAAQPAEVVTEEVAEEAPVEAVAPEAVVEETPAEVVEEAPVAATEEAPAVEEKVEEAPVVEAAKEEAPKEESKAEEAPAAEASTEKEEKKD